MLNWEQALASAPKWMGNKGKHPCQYFAPDEDALYGRYWDGKAISQHPHEGEIAEYFEFWIALANSEQKEILQAMYDVEIGINFGKAMKGKDDFTIVNEAIKWWDKHYHWEVKEFMQYLEWKKGTLRDVKGYDPTKAHKFKGSVPQRVKQFVLNANPHLVRYDGKSESKFDKIFYSIFSKALIGGN